eukprot:6312483-Amphidinium_carterae.1
MVPKWGKMTNLLLNCECSEERAFRLLTRAHGTKLAYTPMIHAEPFAADKAFLVLATDSELQMQIDTERKTLEAWTRKREEGPLLHKIGFSLCQKGLDVTLAEL